MPTVPVPPGETAGAQPALRFADRHIGPREADIAHMLRAVGYESLDHLASAAVPAAIQAFAGLDLPPALDEAAALEELRAIAARNSRRVSMIGLGYYDTVTPPVVVRRLLENPGWYTAYTPYQPEISQGRLEALLNFQTMVADLTGLPVANASLLDEASAVAEAVTLMHRASVIAGDRVLVDNDLLPQSLAVLRTRCEPLRLTVELFDASVPFDAEHDPFDGHGVFGVVLQAPGASGAVRDHTDLIAAAHARGALVTVACDLLALCLLRSPGESGADVAVGSSQRFGVPLGFGGPHAGFIAVRTGLERSLPGRLVGVSLDSAGAPAYRLALQTREQHIRRERATSNICTAQVLLAVIASMYAVWHGPEGLLAIARRVHAHAGFLAARLVAAGFPPVHEVFFDTVLVETHARTEEIIAAADRAGINLGRAGATRIRIACDELTDRVRLARVLAAFGGSTGEGSGFEPEGADAGGDAESEAEAQFGIPAALRRTSAYLTHPVFSAHRSETSMLRYLRRLADQDYALDRGMIPLGSCTMKLNATTEMEPITWPEFAGVHPFAPSEQVRGYLEMIQQLERWLCEITGYDAVSLQPNAGSQGELAGLLAIRAYHASRGESRRRVCLIPSSAHGTNAASAVMAGMQVVVVSAASDGTVDLADLQAKVASHRADLAAIMVTYPSTHGVFEDTITEICRIVHEASGQVYVDGANLNALVGLAKPGRFGADLSHLNLHKTFCIPHGGGGPGVGPLAVRAHLASFLPGHPMQPASWPPTACGPVSAAPFGSAGILPIPWAYIRMMGADGLARATKVAVLTANYVARRLSGHFPVLYAGRDGLVAHECVLDVRPLTRRSGVTVEDVAKRLVDYGFHAPTVSFPVAGTLMVEPTESEDLEELDRFIDAMIAIRAEIDRVADGDWPLAASPLRLAPHTAATIVGVWDRPYSRQAAVFPAGSGQPSAKYWPPVGRIDSAHGDRNLVCTCPAPEAFERSADSVRTRG